MSIALVYVYRILSRLYFHLPILFVFFYEHGLDIFRLELLLAAYGLTICLAAGIAAPLGRLLPLKGVIAIGEVLKALGLAMIVATAVLVTDDGAALTPFTQPLAIDQGFWWLLAAQVLGGIGYSLAQGTDSALLRSLHRDDQMAAYRGHESRTASLIFLAVLVAGAIGSVLYRFDAELPFLAALVAALASAVAILLVKAPAPLVSATPATGGGAAAAKPAATGGRVQGEAGWMIYYILMRAFALATFVGFLPALFFLTLKIDLYWFGLVLSLFNLAAFLSARYAVKVMDRIGTRAIAVVMPAIGLVSLVLFATASQNLIAGLAAITALGLATGGIRPVTMTNLNKLPMATAVRARLIGRMERWYGLTNAAVLAVGGWFLAAYGFVPLMTGVAALFAVLVLAYALAGSRLIGATVRQPAAKAA
ncbi:MFS transporter [Tistrella bauzanensis]|uniref:MFS transporter n=1 Tax=Tistrella bauzanensis TaxID=657419 RepID=A0ABQ1IWP1_9PROT|nr:MFS transporter [Tistrella bauzanensis]GGB53087.1 MFS transporter [Tistrella bauzanensis]